MPERIRPRRPIAWNALLRKGHVHSEGRTATRRAHRALIDDELEAYYAQKEKESEGVRVRDQSHDSGPLL